jgi:hypothetical protein
MGVPQTEKPRTGEAVKVDCAQHLEEAYTMLGILREVLVDHVEGGLKHSVQYRRNLRDQMFL